VCSSHCLPQPDAKWEALSDILEEIQAEGTGRTLIMTGSDRSRIQLAEYLCAGARPLLLRPGLPINTKSIANGNLWADWTAVPKPWHSALLSLPSLHLLNFRLQSKLSSSAFFFHFPAIF
jgi:hypothetical protein